jgi:hypothetical protein
MRKQSTFMILAVTMLASFGAFAWQPTGSISELYDDWDLMRLRSGVKMASFSSYDRTGGNNDGFSGAYSKLREEDGNSVIAEMDGPGCIYRLWMTHSSGEEPGLLDRKGEHIRIYLDGDEEPALDVPIESLFDNSLARFPKPICGQGIGGFYCYMPIPYQKSCKVVVDGLGVRFYQLNYATFPSADGVETFSMELTDAEKTMLEYAVVLWSAPLGELQSKKVIEVPVVHKPGGKDYQVFSYTLPAETPGKVTGITLTGLSPEQIERTQIQITFSDPKAETIRLPLDFYFGCAFQAEPFTSLLFGCRDNIYYNRIPFAYEGECTIRLHSIVPLEGVMRVYLEALRVPVDDFGVLKVQYNESLPTAPDVYHPLLQTEGSGHVVGTYMVTEGPHGLPFWLEGDDRWTIDGELRIHGTGSEDYYNCGWYALEGRLNGPEALPSHGFPIYGTTDNTMRAAAFRWHLSDPVPFDNSIDFSIEHGEANRHIAEYRSVVFWYAAR